MKINIHKGIGTGPTELSAFDQALVSAGVANYNLIYLSSVLPAGSEVVRSSSKIHESGAWGDRLYLVIAQKRTILRNQEVWAGIGWIQDTKTHKGLLVEHEGHNEAEVRADIEHSLNALAKNRNTEFGPINMEVVGTKCENDPVCALVVAVFESAAWEEGKMTENTNILKRFVDRVKS